MTTPDLVEVTGHAQQAAWRRHELPPVETVRPGLHSVPVPFPGNPMRYTLSYVLLDGDECIVVDPGFESEEGLQHLRTGLERLGVGLGGVTGIISTHFHTDHLGLARRVAEASGAWIAMGEAERRYISDFTDADAEEALDRERMRSWGVPQERAPEAAMTAQEYLSMRALAEPDRRLSDGERITLAGHSLAVVSTPGHTPGHICLWADDDELILAGDHVLPRISPNVSLEIRGDSDPLRNYLESLEAISERNHYEVAPAHEYRFRGIANRAQSLIKQSHARSAEVADALDNGAATVYGVASRVSWSRGFDSLHGLQFRLALAETAAHLQFMSTSSGHPPVPGLPSTATTKTRN